MPVISSTLAMGAGAGRGVTAVEFIFQYEGDRAGMRRLDHCFQDHCFKADHYDAVCFGGLKPDPQVFQTVEKH